MTLSTIESGPGRWPGDSGRRPLSPFGCPDYSRVRRAIVGCDGEAHGIGGQCGPFGAAVSHCEKRRGKKEERPWEIRRG